MNLGPQNQTNNKERDHNSITKNLGPENETKLVLTSIQNKIYREIIL